MNVKEGKRRTITFTKSKLVTNATKTHHCTDMISRTVIMVQKLPFYTQSSEGEGG